MRSTGEVMGVAADFPTAFAKAQAAAGVRLPRSGTVFLTVTDTDKPAVGAIAAQLHDLGFAIVATGGHRRRDRAHGHPGRAAEQARRGLAARRRQDRGRRRRARDQHADRHGRPHRRLRDPPRGDRPRRSRASRRWRAAWRRRARSRRRATASRRVLSLQEIHRASGTSPRRCRRAPASSRAAPPPHGRASIDAPRPRRRRGLRPRARRRWRRAADRTSRPSAAAACPSRPARVRRLRRALGRRPRTGRRRSPGSSRCSRPPSAGAAASTSGRSCRARSPSLGRHADGTLDFLLEDVGPGDEPARGAGRGRRRLAARPARPRLRAAARGPPARSSSAAASGSRRSRSSQDALGASALVLLGFRDAAHADGAALLERRRGSRPTTARSATTAS